MKTRKLLIPLLLVASAPVLAGQTQQSPSASTAPQASQQAPQTNSVAEAARKAREQRKDQPKTAKVFTNDDLENLKGTISVIGNGPSDSQGAASAADSAAAGGAKGQAYWQKRFADARRALADDQRELDVLQREYGLKQVQFYSNPNVELREETSRDDLDKTLAELNAKKQDVDKDNQNLSDLEDQLRKAGGEPGWANPPDTSSSSASSSAGSSSVDAPSTDSAAAQPAETHADDQSAQDSGSSNQQPSGSDSAQAPAAQDQQ